MSESELSISAIQALISTYTTQLESYDQMISNLVMTFVAFIGVIFGIIVTLIRARQDRINELIKNEPCIERDSSKKAAGNMKKYSFHSSLSNINRAISCMFLCFPPLVTLFLYIFSMSSRKVAVYRGYLMYLEKMISKRTSKYISFDDTVVREFIDGNIGQAICYGADDNILLTNCLGPLVMLLFVIGILFVGFRFAYYFSNWENEEKNNTVFFKNFSFLFYALIFICILFSVVCMIDLATNGEIMKAVRDFCFLKAGM